VRGHRTFRQSPIAALVLAFMPLECEELTGSIIGAAIAVHRELGPGFIESVYGNALDLEMRHRQIPFVRQIGVPVLYRGIEVGMHRLDLFVQGEIVVELKAVKELADVHFAVVRSYLRATHNKHGLILNFAKYTLEAKRVVALQDPSRSSNGRCGT
jgi:GxxExxY protein